MKVKYVPCLVLASKAPITLAHTILVSKSLSSKQHTSINAFFRAIGSERQ